MEMKRPSQPHAKRNFPADESISIYSVLTTWNVFGHSIDTTMFPVRLHHPINFDIIAVSGEDLSFSVS